MHLLRKEDKKLLLHNSFSVFLKYLAQILKGNLLFSQALNLTYPIPATRRQEGTGTLCNG